MMIGSILMGISAIFLFQCSYSNKVDLNFKNPSAGVNHEAWTALLQKHVKGRFLDYKGIKEDRQKLKNYIEYLGNNPPDEEKWTKNEQIAYWINLYNAATIELVLRYYPVESIKDIGSKISIPFVNSAFDIDFISVGDKTFNLNNIEHGILRKHWNEPRIHFAVNCASFSCPTLRKEAYIGEKLDAQLTDQARNFVRNDQLNKINPKNPKVSQIFNWFSEDFKKASGSVIKFINQYSEVKIDENAELSYLDYNWRLNDTANFGSK